MFPIERVIFETSSVFSLLKLWILIFVNLNLDWIAYSTGAFENLSIFFSGASRDPITSLTLTFDKLLVSSIATTTWLSLSVWQISFLKFFKNFLFFYSIFIAFKLIHNWIQLLDQRIVWYFNFLWFPSCQILDIKTKMEMASAKPWKSSSMISHASFQVATPANSFAHLWMDEL